MRIDKKRRQLTLFVPRHAVQEVERIRQKYNPEQYALIEAHITLCREDEFSQEADFLDFLHTAQITDKDRINFGTPIRFDNVTV
jgi:hypothetical protein